MKLTQRRIEDLECPAGRRDMMVFDDEQTGLGVRVTAGGKVRRESPFSLNIDMPARSAVSRLGACSAISLAAARKATRAIMGDVAKGRDPAGERKEAVQQAKRKAAHEALTLAALARAMGGPAPRRQARALRRGGRARPPLRLRQAPEHPRRGP